MIPGEVCREEGVAFTNNSTNGTQFHWDFCAGDIALTPTASTLINMATADIPVGLDIVEDKGLWTGFVASRDENRILKLTFNDSPDNTPIISKLPSNTAYNSPEWIELIKEGDT
ncbi:MAG: hypothetical protein RID18_14060, partial [Cytophagales bacterium]